MDTLRRWERGRESIPLRVPDETDDLLTELAGFGPMVTKSLRRRTQVVITAPATSLRTATAAALALVGDSAPAAPVSVQVMTTEDSDISAGLIEVPADSLSVSQTADRLEVSRQAVLKRVSAGSIPAVRVGDVWVIPAALVHAPHAVA